MASQSFDQAVSRLAQYRPFSGAGQDLHAVLRDLVLAATAEADTGGTFESLSACRDAFRTLWRLDVELDELRAVRDGLIKEGKARKAGGGFALTSESLAEQRATKERSEKIRELAFGEWEEYVRTTRPDLTDKEFAQLIADLEVWLERIIARHGTEAALVLYPDNPRAQKFLDSIDDLLPSPSGRIRQVRDDSLAHFVRQPSSAQRTYLADRLDVSYFLTVLTLDPAASQLVQDKVKGHRLYLDTNVLYAVLGLSQPQEALSALRLVDLSRNLGYELAVTKWTVDELRTSLRRARERVGRVPLPRRELAHLLATQSDEKSVVQAFWAAYRDRGVQPQDFFDFFEQFQTLLEGHGIQIIDEGTVAIDQNQVAIDEQLVLLDRYMGSGWKEDVVMEHDVKHRLLVERLRGAGNLTFSNARYWFITRDGKLPPYAMATMDGSKVQLPFCVATSAWLQVMRAFTPRTDDLDRTVVDLLASPFVTVRRGRPARVVEEVVGRIDQAAQGDLNLASAVLADTALVAHIGAAQDAAERANRVDLAFEKKTSELNRRLVEADQEANTLQAAAAAAEAKAAKQAAARELEIKRRQVLESELDRVRRESVENAATLQRELESERLARQAVERRTDAQVAATERHGNAEVEGLRNELDQFRRRVLQASSALGGFLAVAGAVVLVATGTVESAGLIVVTITLGLIVALLAMCVAIGRTRGNTVAYWVFGVVTIAGFAWFVVDKVDESSSPPGSSEPARTTGR